MKADKKVLQTKKTSLAAMVTSLTTEKDITNMVEARKATAIGKLEEKFAGEGRVLIRPSGTEPLVRVMIEGKDQQVIQEEARKLAV